MSRLKMPGSSRGRRGRRGVSTRDIELRSDEEEMEFRRELERVIRFIIRK